MGDQLGGADLTYNTITSVIEGGTITNNVYKTNVTNAADVDIDLLPTGHVGPVLGVQIYASQPILFGTTSDTLAQSDSTDASVGGYVPGGSWITTLWGFDNLRVKAATASAATVYVNIIKHRTTKITG